MTAARTVSGPAYLEAIEEIDGDLANVIEEFDCAVNVEALHRTKETGKYLFSQCGDNSFTVVSCRTRTSA